jgi:hypothetical protein
VNSGAAGSEQTAPSPFTRISPKKIKFAPLRKKFPQLKDLRHTKHKEKLISS